MEKMEGPRDIHYQKGGVRSTFYFSPWGCNNVISLTIVSQNGVRWGCACEVCTLCRVGTAEQSNPTISKANIPCPVWGGAGEGRTKTYRCKRPLITPPPSPPLTAISRFPIPDRFPMERGNNDNSSYPNPRESRMGTGNESIVCSSCSFLFERSLYCAFITQ